jgi:hypothetical protein
MQSRLYALVVSGHKKLESSTELREKCLKDQANWDYRFGYDSQRVKGTGVGRGREITTRVGPQTTNREGFTVESSFSLSPHFKDGMLVERKISSTHDDSL